MIRNFYSFFLLFIVAITTARAQRNVDLQLLPTRTSTHPLHLQDIAPYDTVLYNDTFKYYTEWNVVNLGPDSVQPGDTLCIKSMNNTLSKNTNITLAPGDTITLAPPQGSFVFSPPANATFPYIDTLIWCDSLFAVTPASATSITDPPANNHNCVPIVAYAIKMSNGINDIAGNQALRLYPNPATDKLTIEFDLGGSAQKAQVVLRNLLGAQVYNRLLETGTKAHSIDVGHLPKGLYIAELRYDGHIFVQKLSIQ
ncbi:T9SS type A sorting domain-containing protein [Polluticoccus soli]|uniref:T9SS type A sorting domain-containing protein n=1 Tax=Polluticoccus soli TaxID=3034150 RepID=UPI0023E0B7A2|nr:T9SS type A sorting domain-containing protein [Flavipsychrobacter sp. JY13-12]